MTQGEGRAIGVRRCPMLGQNARHANGVDDREKPNRGDVTRLVLQGLPSPSAGLVAPKASVVARAHHICVTRA